MHFVVASRGRKGAIIHNPPITQGGITQWVMGDATHWVMGEFWVLSPITQWDLGDSTQNSPTHHRVGESPTITHHQLGESSTITIGWWAIVGDSPSGWFGWCHPLGDGWVNFGCYHPFFRPLVASPYFHINLVQGPVHSKKNTKKKLYIRKVHEK
jgi:hypothetical protein